MGCGQSALAADASPKRKQTRKHVSRLSDTGKQSGSDTSVDRSRSSRGSKRGVSRNGSRSSKGSKGGKEWWSSLSGASAGSDGSAGRPIRRSQSEHFADRLVVNASKTNVADLYDIGHTLGTGSYAVVRFAVHKESRAQVAIKCVKVMNPATQKVLKDGRKPIDGGSENSGVSVDFGPTLSDAKEEKAATFELKYLVREVDILMQLDHPAIVHMHEYFVSKSGSKIYIVLQYLAGGELLSVLEQRGVPFSEHDAHLAMIPLLQAIRYIHDKGIVNRDIKLENLMLEDEQDLRTVKMVDFGLAKTIHEQNDPDMWNPGTDLKETICGTRAYMAPEVMSSAKGCPPMAGDMWSAGVCLYTLLQGRLPFKNKDHAQHLKDVMECNLKLEQAPCPMSARCRDFIRALIHVDPHSRVTAARALEHQWVKAGVREQTQLLNLGRVQAALRKYVDDRDLPPRTFTNQVIIQQGARNPFLYMIIKGTVEVIVAGTGANAENEMAVGFCIEGQYLGEFLLFTPEELSGSFPPDETDCLQLVQTRGGAATVEFSPIRVHTVGTVVVQLVEADEIMRLFGYDEAAFRAILGEARLRYRKIMDCHAALAGIPGLSEAASLGPNSIVADVPMAADSQRAVAQQMTLPGLAVGSGSSGHGHGGGGGGGGGAGGASHAHAQHPSARLPRIASGPQLAGPPAGAPLPASGQRTAPPVIQDFFGSSRLGGPSGAAAGSQRPPM